MTLRMTKARIDGYVRGTNRFVIGYEPYARNSQGRVAKLWELRVLTTQLKSRRGLWRTAVVFQASSRQEVVDKAVELLKEEIYRCYFQRFALRLKDGSFKRFDCQYDLVEWARSHDEEIDLLTPELDTSVSLPMYQDNPRVFDEGEDRNGPRPRLARLNPVEE